MYIQAIYMHGCNWRRLCINTIQTSLNVCVSSVTKIHEVLHRVNNCTATTHQPTKFKLKWMMMKPMVYLHQHACWSYTFPRPWEIWTLKLSKQVLKQHFPVMEKLLILLITIHQICYCFVVFYFLRGKKLRLLLVHIFIIHIFIFIFLKLNLLS